MLKSQSHSPQRPDTARFHSVAVQRVISAIRQRLDQSISLGEMASVAYMSPFHFNRTFRQVTGLPPRRFLSALRFEAATKKLLETDSSITDICLDVGYNSLGTFVRRFSEALGISPMRLRLLRRSDAASLLDRLRNKHENGNPPAKAAVRVEIEAPAYFRGPIFVGLFPEAIPAGMPVACAVKFKPGPFSITNVPDGRYYVYAMGLALPGRTDDYFRYETALRGGGEVVDFHNRDAECKAIVLRPPLPTDPPILLNLPVMLEKANLGASTMNADSSERQALTESGVRRWKRHTREEKLRAVSRMRNGDNVTALAREFGVQRKLLYVWKYQIEGRPFAQGKNRAKLSDPAGAVMVSHIPPVFKPGPRSPVSGN